MDIKLIFFVGFIALVASKDIGERLTSTVGDKIYDEKKEASPAIWVQDQNVTITANDTEVITQVIVTDLRPEKDGVAKIVEGGVGKNNVTIELKSPAVFRGFHFHVEVYAVPMEEYVKVQDKTVQTNNKDDEVEKTKIPHQEQANTPKVKEDSSDKKQPIHLSKDIKVDKRETIEQSQSTTPKVSATTKGLQNPSSLAKNDEDHGDKQSIVPLIMPTLKPTITVKDNVQSNEKDDPKEESFKPSGDDNKAGEISSPNNGFTTIAKNVNVDTQTSESVISSKTTQAPRKYRETNEKQAQDKAYPIQENSTSFIGDSIPTETTSSDEFTTTKTVTIDNKSTESVINSKTAPAPRKYRDTQETGKLQKTDSATDKVKVQTNASGIKVEDMKPYPMLRKDCETGNDDEKTLCNACAYGNGGKCTMHSLQ